MKTANGVMPVLDTGIQQNLSKTRQHFQSKNWIPVSGHWDDTHLVVFSRLPYFTTLLNRYVKY
ncbi:MAG: hypothetical protein O7161_03215 [Wolbachia endosymbiont of Halictus tumulorum]|nr:hypothetical protein [Wolbachia endosymbiont of Halictus tumulorum]